MNENQHLFGKTEEEIKTLIASLKLPKYTVLQIFDWIYKKRIGRWYQMSNLSKTTRSLLEQLYPTKQFEPIKSLVAKDLTKKYVFDFSNQKQVEAVYIPEIKRNTLCVSIQSGCSLGCKFCKTSHMSPAQNLSLEQLIAQLLFIQESQSITNIVLMGMGEPFLNWNNVKNFLNILCDNKFFGFSKRKIVLSTIGIIEPLMEFIDLQPCKLAISMHTPFHEERKYLMPIEQKYPINTIIELIRKYKSNFKTSVSIEYIIFKNINHTKHHANEMAKLLHGLNIKINLIPYNPIGTDEFKKATMQEMIDFQNFLMKKGFRTTIRKSKGVEIQAACGMLASQITDN